MTKLLIYFSACCLLFLDSSAQVARYDSLVVEHVSFYTETPISISCVDFEGQFEDILNVRLIINPDTIAKLTDYIKNAKFADTPKDIDVRAKLILKSADGNYIRICMSQFDILINGRLVMEGSSFYFYLRSLIGKYHLPALHKRAQTTIP